MKKLTAIILALVMLTALCACGSKTDPQATADPQTVEYPLVCVSKETVKADLDGDGKEDEIYVDTTVADPNAEPRITALKINGTDFTQSLYAAGFYSNSPDEKNFVITDVDAADGRLEIALMDYGPSDDNVTDFFRWDGKAVTYIGQVSGLAYYSTQAGKTGTDLSFDGKGTVGAYVRLSVLQTWFAACDYRVGDDGKFAVVPQQLYYPLGNNTYPVTALKDVYVYAKNDLGSAKSVLKTGGALTITATDNAEWVLCKNADGADCWLHLASDGQMIDTPDGAHYSGDVLDGLVFAD